MSISAAPGPVVAVTPFNFEIRISCDYDVNYLQDRVTAKVYANGQYTGNYCSVRPMEDLSQFGRGYEHELIRRYGPDLQRMAIDEFTGNRYRQEVGRLSNELAALKAHVNRPRWWQRRTWRAWWDKHFTSADDDRFYPMEHEVR